jgi:hypothetical protein
MPNQDQVSDELQLEVIPDSESTVDNDDTQEGEQSSQELNLEKDSTADSKLSPAEKSAKEQEDSWLAKVIAGKSKVDEAPQWLQSKLNARMEVLSAPKQTEDIVKQALANERKAQEFSDLQKQIPPLSKAQAEELKSRYNQLKGADNVVALKTVLDAMGLSPKLKEAEARSIAKGKIALPRSGQPAVRKSDTLVGGVPKSVIHNEKEWNKMIRSGQVD